VLERQGAGRELDGQSGSSPLAQQTGHKTLTDFLLLCQIVDLIRSDLQSCCSPSSVQVPKLIALETYESVHQLVTTVVGRLEQGISEIEAVERCFPPGKPPLHFPQSHSDGEILRLNFC
jgi:hypothetical protein